MPVKNNILVEASKILSTISPIYVVTHQLVSAVLEIFSGKERNEGTKHVKV
jgi:hypothetical protein